MLNRPGRRGRILTAGRGKTAARGSEENDHLTGAIIGEGELEDVLCQINGHSRRVHLVDSFWKRLQL